jgi:CBS domain-containing protein
MHVAAVIKRKGSSVVSITPDRTIADATNLLTENRIGAVLVMDGAEGIRGIISERDIIRALATSGAECLTRPVAETMTKQVVTCQETDTLNELMAMMTERRFRHLPVVTDGALVGIVSIGDVVKHHVAEVEMEATAMRDYITHS